MELNPLSEVKQKLKRMARKEGLTLNALLVPYLNDIAAGRLVRGSHWVEPSKQKAA